MTEPIICKQHIKSLERKAKENAYLSPTEDRRDGDLKATDEGTKRTNRFLLPENNVGYGAECIGESAE